MKTLVVTIGATATQVTTQNLYASVMVVKASGTDYLGDSTVSSTAGIPLSTTPLVIPNYTPRGIPLNSLYVSGTQNDKVIFLYEPSA